MLKTMTAERMADAGAPYVFDVRAILAWASAAGNEYQIVLQAILDGTVVIYNRVWRDFCDAYPDDEKLLKLLGDFPKQRVTPEHRLAAAALAELAGDEFTPIGPYDDCTDLIVAGIANCVSGTVVTSAERESDYAAIDGIGVVSYEDFLDGLG